MTENQTSIIAGMDIQEDVLKLRIENNKLLDVINGQDVKIADLEKQIVEILDAKCTSCTELGGMQLKINRLEQQIEKMKNCRNCKNYMIDGVCGHFTQVGWCKNWEMKE